MNKFLNLALIAAAGLSLSSCGKTNSDLQKVADRNVIYVGITIYEPMDYFGEDGETIVGFDADLANEFAKSVNASAKFIPISWDSKVLELDGGFIDLIWNGMTASDELGEKIDFSLPYATNFQCVVTKNVTGYTDISSLDNKNIVVEQGSAGDNSLKEVNARINRVNSQLDALNEVLAGTSDCCVIDYTMAYNLVGKGSYQNLAIVNSDVISFDKEVFAVGLRKSSDLKEKLDEFLKTSYTNGTLNRLAELYGVAINEEAFK